MTLASDARAIVRAGIRAVDPARVVRTHVHVRRGGFGLDGRAFVPGRGGRLHLVAIGKAAGPMADAAAALLRPTTDGIALLPRGYPPPRRDTPAVFGDHPVPEAASFRAGQRLLDYVAATAAEDVVLFLVSGGGSATVEAPSDGLTAADLTATTRELLASGAPIGAMNAIRRHLSRTKGGRTVDALRAGRFATLALSDVVGDRPEDIASGPTVPDPSRYATALRAVRQYRLARRLPPRVLGHLRAGAAGRRAETPKPGASRFRDAPFVLGGTNRIALDAAARAAARAGYRPTVDPRPLVGETAPAGRSFGRAVARLADRTSRTAFLRGGETTVTLGRSPGRGGRNQEFAIAAAPALAGRDALVLSAGTDGIDGPTDAAGGWVDGGTVARATTRRVDLAAVLRRHATYAALDRLGSLWITGATGTNVIDLHVGLVGRRAPRPRS